MFLELSINSNYNVKKWILEVEHDVYQSFTSNYVEGFRKCDYNSNYVLDIVELSMCFKQEGAV